MEGQQQFESAYRIASLFSAQLKGDITPEEERELQDWMENAEANSAWYREFSAEEKLTEQFRKYQGADRMAVWNKTRSKIEKNNSQPVKTLWLSWQRVVVAAAVLLIVGTGVYLFQRNTDRQTNSNDYALDIKAGGDKAYLTTSGGVRISLTDAATGQIANETGISVVKNKEGQVVYQVAAETGDESAKGNGMNSIETPRGGQYQVELPDGSKVWLNSASHLRFPTSFKNQHRVVEMSGEAYFEVTKDASRPFIVKSKGQEIEVLGTHFNVNAYTDEPEVKTTLLEGRVRVAIPADASEKVMLSPNQQAVLKGAKLSVKPVIAAQAVDWKNGDFIFSEESLESIMRKVSRWYDVEVVYEDITKEKVVLGGLISRSRSLSAVLRMMESTGKVHFEVKGRRVIVTD